MKFYDNPQCISVEDYQTDMKRFKYIKRLLNQYNSSTDLNIRLLLNHIIMVYNLFDNQIATRILFFKIDSKYWPILKPILMRPWEDRIIFLKIFPPQIIVYEIRFCFLGSVSCYEIMLHVYYALVIYFELLI